MFHCFIGPGPGQVGLATRYILYKTPYTFIRQSKLFVSEFSFQRVWLRFIKRNPVMSNISHCTHMIEFLFLQLKYPIIQTSNLLLIHNSIIKSQVISTAKTVKVALSNRNFEGIKLGIVVFMKQTLPDGVFLLPLQCIIFLVNQLKQE